MPSCRAIQIIHILSWFIYVICVEEAVVAQAMSLRKPTPAQSKQWRPLFHVSPVTPDSALSIASIQPYIDTSPAPASLRTPVVNTKPAAVTVPTVINVHTPAAAIASAGKRLHFTETHSPQDAYPQHTAAAPGSAQQSPLSRQQPLSEAFQQNYVTDAQARLTGKSFSLLLW